jgi:hypothetical protein
VKVVPVRDKKFQPFPVYFRRLIKPEEAGLRLEGFGKKIRKRVAEILGIKTEEDYERVRGEIKERFPEASLVTGPLRVLKRCQGKTDINLDLKKEDIIDACTRFSEISTA